MFPPTKQLNWTGLDSCLLSKVFAQLGKAAILAFCVQWARLQHTPTMHQLHDLRRSYAAASFLLYMSVLVTNLTLEIGDESCTRIYQFRVHFGVEKLVLQDATSLTTAQR